MGLKLAQMIATGVQLWPVKAPPVAKEGVNRSTERLRAWASEWNRARKTVESLESFLNEAESSGQKEAIVYTVESGPFLKFRYARGIFGAKWKYELQEYCLFVQEGCRRAGIKCKWKHSPPRLLPLLIPQSNTHLLHLIARF